MSIVLESMSQKNVGYFEHGYRYDHSHEKILNTFIKPFSFYLILL